MSVHERSGLTVVPIIPGDVRKAVPHTHSDGLTLIVTTTDGQTVAIGWSSAAEALRDVARIVDVIAENPPTTRKRESA